MKVIYEGVEIAYEEDTNRWNFTLRGRERRAESLAKAKEAIDKPAPKGAKPFERFDAWMIKWPEVERVTVTSLSTLGYGSPRARVTRQNGTSNNIERCDTLYPCNADNDALVEKIQALNAEQERLGKEKEKLKGKLKVYDPPREECHE